MNQMKKSYLFTLLSVLIGLSVNAQDSISVLFIGNSYVYTNDLPSTLNQLATSLGNTASVSSKVNGGYTFQMHANDPQTYAAIHQQPWDVVVLQAQSQEPSFPFSQVTTNTLPYSTQLADSVKAANFCSNVMYFMTWGRQNGDPQWDSINTFDKMNSRLHDAYMRFADSVDAMVSPVGVVWKYVRDNHPSIQLYVADGSHPSPAGTYLAACTFYTGLFRNSPVGSTYLGGLDQATATILQEASALLLDSLDQFNLHPVDQPTQASFDFTVNGATVQFSSTSSYATEWHWQFGDGSTSMDENPTNTYTLDDVYNVRLIASSVCNSDTIQQSVTINQLNLDEEFEGVFVHEFPGYFEVKNVTPVLYQIFTIDGKILQTECMLTPGIHQIKKESTMGIILLRNSQDNSKVYRYINY
jgi:PKD repeat protein